LPDPDPDTSALDPETRALVKRSLENVEKLQSQIGGLVSLTKSQEQRIRALELESKPLEGVGLDGDLTGQERKVMQFISANPDVTKQDIVDHFKGEMARVPVFNTIDSLVRYGIIEDNLDPKNRQVHRLSANKSSIFLSVLQELDQFEKSFPNLLQKIMQSAKETFGSQPDSLQDNPLMQPYQLFDNMLRSYVFRYTYVWPAKFQDRRDVLNKLLGIVLSRVSKIRETIPKIPVEQFDYFSEAFLVTKIQGTEFLKSFVSAAERFGLTKEIEPVLDSLWNINKEIQGYAYPEPRLFSWQGFEYGKDDWRKLLSVAEKHPDETLVKKRKIAIEGLLDKPVDVMLK